MKLQPAQEQTTPDDLSFPKIPSSLDEEIMAGRMPISPELMEFWRQCSDDELARWFRDPAQWSYVVRAPNGHPICDGKASTREECEEWAIRHAEDYVCENAMIVVSEGVKVPAFASLQEHLAFDFQLGYRWDWSLLGEWRLVLWPPINKVKRQPGQRTL